MTRYCQFLLVSLVLLHGLATNLCCQEARPIRPNIVFFLVDDLGWQDTSVAFWDEPTEFQHHFRTPNVARLASQGMRFSRAYSCCVCSPTRTSIMTGQNAARHRVTNWTFDPGRETSGQTNRLMPPRGWNRRGLQPDQLTLPELLQTAGYTTIHCGKAHWGAADTPGSDPTRLGFDVNIGGHHAGAPGSYQGQDNYGADPNRPERMRWAVPGLEKYHQTPTHLTDALAIEANAAIETAVDGGKPFFLYMAPYAVHTPIQPHIRFIANYQGRNYANGRDIPDVEAKYASLVEGFDDALGQILNKLDELGQAENTIVVFTSDNGGLSVHTRAESARGTGKNTHCWPLREGKGSAYEGGIRVPLIVSWARTAADSELQKTIPVAAGARTTTMVICEDYLPTLCRWAGVDMQTTLRTTAIDQHMEKVHEIDGQDFTDSLDGKQMLTDRKLFFHYPHVWGPRGRGYQPHSTLLAGNWKLIYFYHARRWELYDLATDIGENDNLFYQRKPGGPADILTALLPMFGDQLRKYSAQLPETKPGANYLQELFQPNFALQPRASDEQRGQLAGWGRGRTWLDQHQEINRIAQAGDVDLVFLGDSITQSWGGPGRQVAQAAPDIWTQFYAKRKAANFGISGDGVRNVLWRIENGNLDGIDPQVVVLNIGTNDLAHDDPETIAAGIEQIVLRIEERRQRTKILLLGIFPRGQHADDPRRIKAAKVNELLKPIADGRKTFFLDISDYFLDDHRKARASCYRQDYLHLSPQGYAAWAQAIEPFLQEHLN